MNAVLLLVGLTIMALGWQMPGHYFPWLTFQQEAMAALGACVIGLSAWLGGPWQQRTRWPVLALVACAAAAIPLLQLAAGQILFVSDGVLAAAYLAGFGLTIAVGATLSNGKPGPALLESLTGLFVAGAIGAAALGMVQWQNLAGGGFIDGLAPGGRVYANFGQPNHLAVLMALGIVGLLRWYETRRIGGAACALAVAYLGWMLVLTLSRAGWLFVAVLILWLLATKWRVGMRLGVTPIVVGAGFFVGAVNALAPINEMLLLTSPASIADRLHPGTRWIHWQSMWDAAWRAPWAGWGWTQVGLAQLAVVLDHPTSGEVLGNSHNLILDLLVWNGVLLGATLVGVLVWWLVRQVRRCDSAGRALALAMVGVLYLHSIVEFPLDFAFFLLPAGLLMGALDGLDESTAGLSSSRRTLAVPSLALTALFAFVVYEYMKVDAAGWTLRFVVAGIGVDKVATAPEPEVLLLDRPRAQHRYLMSPVRDGMSAGELAQVRKTAMRHVTASGLFRYAVLAGINGHPDDATLSLALLCKMFPGRYCDEGRLAWPAQQRRYPALQSIAYPGAAPE